MLHFPAATLVRFFANHHLLSASGQPQWHTVTGGAQEYVARLSAPFAHRIRLGCGAAAVTRRDGKVQLCDTSGQAETYDRVVFAGHGNETLALLQDADATETALLSAFRYQKNRAVLHRDAGAMPQRRRCWASWVYASDGDSHNPRIAVTYWMNRLQGIDNRYPLFVSLNPRTPIAPNLIFDETEFDHPVFDQAAIAAQPRLAALQGSRNCWFAGAHLGHGFHEDGLASAVAVARAMGAAIPWEQNQTVPAAAQKTVRPRPALAAAE
jgi:predicted NAD/FAD-binding protein